MSTSRVVLWSGLMGKFCFDPAVDQSHLMMIAAGSGVTPFVSIMREYARLLGQPGAPQKMSLLVAFRSEKDLICWQELNDMKSNSRIKIITTLSRSHVSGFEFGRVDMKKIQDFLPENPTEATYMTCGPDDMMRLVVETVRATGVPEVQIKMESFTS